MLTLLQNGISVLNFGIKSFIKTKSRGYVFYNSKNKYAEYVSSNLVEDEKVKNLLKDYDPNREIVLALNYNENCIFGIVDKLELEANYLINSFPKNSF